MTLAITNGTIINGRAGDPLTGATILIENERITALGRDGQMNIPREANVKLVLKAGKAAKNTLDMVVSMVTV